MVKVESISNGRKNQMLPEDKPIHGWYQFVLGYPPHLVRHYLSKFDINHDDIVLDPFCGTGTTPVECMKNGVPSYGIDANVMACFASRTKTNINLSVSNLNECLSYIFTSTRLTFKNLGIDDNLSTPFEPSKNIKPIILDTLPELDPESQKLIPTGFISDKPLQKVLILRQIVETIEDQQIQDFFRLSLAYLIVSKAGNVGFGPEVYRTKPKDDFEALNCLIYNSTRMIRDIERFHHLETKPTIINGDSREIDAYLDESLLGQVNGVITSPPYPNEKDYTRSTRLESVLLGFISNKKELRQRKELFLRSNSRNIFCTDTDGEYVRDFASIEAIADEIEEKRIYLKKQSGFEKMYPKIVRHYFGGMLRHLKSLKPFLAPNAKLAYVVGDQMSFFRTQIPTADLLGEIASSLGYKIVDIELWRTRLATATKMQLNENVLILENDN